MCGELQILWERNLVRLSHEILFRICILVHSANFGPISSTSVLFDLIQSILVLFGPLRSILVILDPLWLYSVHFGPIQSILVWFSSIRSFQSTLVLFGPFCPLRSYWSIRSMLVLFSSLWFYSVLFSSHWSYLVHSVNFGHIWSILSTLVLFSPHRSYSVFCLISN